jgi:hypothetical protein
VGLAGTVARPWVRRIALAAVAVSCLTACGDAADQRRQQRIENPVRPDTVNARVGALSLLAVRIETPSDAVHVEGGNVGLFLTIANSGETADTLVAASTVDARQIVYSDGTGDPRPTRVEVPPGGVTSMQYPGGPHLELVGLERDVGGGRFMPVTFRFADAGPVTIDVFVQGFAHPTVSPAAGATPTVIP